MARLFLSRNIAVGMAAFFCLTSAQAYMPSNPVTDKDFLKLPSGKLLSDIKVSGSRLSLSKGSGAYFSETARKNYASIKSESKANLDSKTQWVLMDLDNHQVIDQSAQPNRKIFGASSSKIFVGATLLNKQSEKLSSSQLQLMSNMLVVSSNEAWVELQKQAGDGNSDIGRGNIQAFTQGMGYERMRGFQGNLGKIHGNELTAGETAEFLYDTYHNNYVGAETLWKIMHTCRTGASRGRKYFPSTYYVGAKTGTYDGSSVDPETGSSKNPDGSSYRVQIRNHVMTFNVNGRQYGLVILSNAGSDETVSVLAGGLLREYTSTAR